MYACTHALSMHALFIRCMCARHTFNYTIIGKANRFMTTLTLDEVWWRKLIQLVLYLIIAKKKEGGLHHCLQGYERQSRPFEKWFHNHSVGWLWWPITSWDIKSMTINIQLSWCSMMHFTGWHQEQTMSGLAIKRLQKMGLIKQTRSPKPFTWWWHCNQSQYVHA